jgi:hypothetical protein
MRSYKVLFCVMTVTACAGTEGDVLRSTSDASFPEAGPPEAGAPETGAPDARPPGDAAPPRPRPEPLMTWQIQLTGNNLDTTVDARVYIADIETPLSVIRGLHNAGRIAICYFSGGTMEPFRDDAGRFPPESLGTQLSSYDERWIDVRNPTVRSIMQERLANAARGECDGVYASSLAAFANTNTGFNFDRADQLAYDRWLAGAAHALGLSIGLADGDPVLRQELLAAFDWTIVSNCLSMNNCGSAAPFVDARKGAFLIEYGDESRTAEVCPKAKELGLSAIIKKNGNLDAFRVGCP